MQRAELGAFLRSRRESADPVSLGLHPGRRRRTPGLRREELAQLAGLSVTWLTWLEQARDIGVSRQVIESLARALRLTPPEHAHLLTLAGLTPPAGPPPQPIDDMLVRLVERLHPSPAFVTNPWWDLLAYNDAYAYLAGGLDQRPPAERNVVRLLFTEPSSTGLHLDWWSEARAITGQLRVHLAQYPDDPRGPQLLEALLAADVRFAQLWAEHAVRRFQVARKRLRHPEIGRLDLDYLKLAAATDGRQSVAVFLPADDESAAKLATLG